MKKFLYFMLFYFILSVGICAGIYFLCTSDKVQEFFQEEEVKRELRQKNADFQKRQKKAQRKLRQKNADFQKRQEDPQQELEKKIADFERRHKSLASLPPRSCKDEDGIWDISLYPDDYYNETQQLYKEEIAFNLEQFGEEATEKIVFMINQIPVTGQYTVGTFKSGGDGLRSSNNHESYIEAFDAACVQIAHNAINSICDYAISLAIGYGYTDMAKRIVSCYKPNINIKLVKDRNYWETDDYNLSTHYQSRDAAKEKISSLP